MAYPLNPSRALLHPVWLGSLAVLALNDHVLKGSGLVPEALTGKLSDVAGMLVAPLLLAVLLRVRRRQTWVACHVAVGAVFGAIQLSASAAAGWSALMGLVGFPWVITMDATDLLVLPVLALSAWGFLPAMRRAARTNARRSAECGVAVVGLMCSAATSDVDDCCDGGDCCEPQPIEDTGDVWEEEPPQLPDIEADLSIHNATGGEQIIRIRSLRTDVEIDCEAVAEAPGALLRSSLFQPATTWTLPVDANVAVIDHDPGQAPCYAAWVEADALPPALLFWNDGTPPIRFVPAFGPTGGDGELQLLGTAEEGMTLAGSLDVQFAPEPREPEEGGSCAAQPDESRVGWSTPVPWGPAIVEAIEPGVDGCLGIDLRRAEDHVETWYLCVPATSFAFELGTEIDLRPLSQADGFELAALDELGDELAVPRLTVTAGEVLPSIQGLELAVLPLYDCELASEPRCGSVERPMSVVIGGPEFEAVELHAAAEPTRLVAADRELEVTVAHAQERFVLDPACAQGPDGLGLDLEMVVAQLPVPE